MLSGGWGKGTFSGATCTWRQWYGMIRQGCSHGVLFRTAGWIWTFKQIVTQRSSLYKCFFFRLHYSNVEFWVVQFGVVLHQESLRKRTTLCDACSAFCYMVLPYHSDVSKGNRATKISRKKRHIMIDGKCFP